MCFNGAFGGLAVPQDQALASRRHACASLEVRLQHQVRAGSKQASAGRRPACNLTEEPVRCSMATAEGNAQQSSQSGGVWEQHQRMQQKLPLKQGIAKAIANAQQSSR